jgi:U3 small nucleolar RNA-associated protein 13
LQVLSSGADGLLKLWNTRTGADLATFESHDNRLWGLAVAGGPDESLLASGGDDSRVVVWRDVTADKAAAAEAEEEELVLKQQELSNALAVSLVTAAVAVVSDSAFMLCF